MLLGSVNAASTPAEIEFFETKIRPLFADHCYKCHSAVADKVKGGLRLDDPEAILKGGSSGAVLLPGEPNTSLLMKAVRFVDPDLQMPPKKQLSEEQIATLEAWIKMGVPMPETSAKGPRPLTDVAEARARHWAFQPVQKPAVPEIKLKRWIRTPVDNFVLANIESKQLRPAPAADRRTLIRRASYDLIGLPPTNEEVEAFVKDRNPDAYSRLLDRLLASPHYGERWARYWLDLARFADTKGYLAGGEERRYAFSFTYRDYVVRAFNEDKPYDEFLMEQIAADLLPPAGNSSISASEDKRALAALGFLTLGRRFLNNRDDIIDDRIDVVTRGTMALTVTCARCHDHKFDPIPTKDYYSLHGIFASSHEPAVAELPLLGPLRDSPDHQDYLKQKEKIESEIPEYKSKEVAKYRDELRQLVGDYMLGAKDAATLPKETKFDTFAGERKLNPAVLRRWIKDVELRQKNPDPIFRPWFELAALQDYPKEAKALLTKFQADQKLSNRVLAKALSQATNSLKEAAEAYTKLFKEIDSEWKSALETATNNKPQPTELPVPEREALRQVLYAEGAAVNLPQAEGESILARKLGEGTAPFRNRIQALSWTHAGAPPRAMALLDRDTPVNSHVHIRGNAGNRGEQVPRRFIEVLSPVNRVPFTNGSGRLDLARAIASPANPLTARVFVNRVWMHHFGEGLVRTAGDFGVRTEPPVQAALLDYLAASFVENGWSIKALHKKILLSATYQQTSDAPPESLRADPDNHFLTRMNRQRLDFEALRDTLLAVSGKLDLKLGGIPVDLQTEPFPTRRTLYGLIDRQNLPALYRTFDFANPDTSSQGRFHTTVPQQALFLMNSPFVIEQARNLAERPELKRCSKPREKVDTLYRLLFQRPTTKDEAERGEQFISTPTATSNLSALEKYTQVLLLSNELMFVD